MRCFLPVIFYLITLPAKSQSVETIIAELKAINNMVAGQSCSTGNASVISNRAMNIFLADRTGYLSESRDLSLYTNYVTINSMEGKLTVNHNFQKTGSTDEPIRKLLSVGVSVNIANSFALTFLDKRFENELGLTLNYKWLSKVTTIVNRCNSNRTGSSHKYSMDALRAALVHSLEIELNKKEMDFNKALDAVDADDIPGQKADSAKTIMRRSFYENLQEEYAEKFARQQADILTGTLNFKRVTTGWTSITAYIPIVFPKYIAAQAISAPLQQKGSYPLQVTIGHTRMWESTKTGKLFLTFGAGILFNNSKLGYGLSPVNFTDYQSLGGTDTLHAAALKSQKVYIGDYENYLTPSFMGRVNYYPGSSHVGISFLIEQSLGKYNLLNGRLGVPVVLINSKKAPAANLEFYFIFFDMTNRISTVRKHNNKTSVGLGIGIPFSRLMY